MKTSTQRILTTDGTGWEWMGLLLLLVTVNCHGQNLLPAFLGPPAGVPFPYDSEESYTDNAAVSALNGGTGWNGAYVDRTSINGVQETDDIEAYTDGVAVNALNAGAGWAGAYVDRVSINGVQASDDMEGYSDTAAVNGLNLGTSGPGSGWGGAFVDR